MKTFRASEMTGPEYTEAVSRAPGIIIPLGSFEILGDHGPLGADHFVAARAADLICERSGFLSAPSIPYGDTLELSMFPGTVSVPVGTLSEFYLAVGRSFLETKSGPGGKEGKTGGSSAKSLVYLACHSINIRAADAACRILHTEGHTVAVIDWWKTVFGICDDLIETENAPKGHGGEIITSVVSAVRPDLVKLGKSRNEVPKSGLSFHGARTLTGGGPFYTYGDFTDYCTSGAWGSTNTAGPEKGQILIERAVGAIIPFLSTLSSLPRAPGHA